MSTFTLPDRTMKKNRSRKEIIRNLMENAGKTRSEAEVIAAIELGESEGDIRVINDGADSGDDAVVGEAPDSKS